MFISTCVFVFYNLETTIKVPNLNILMSCSCDISPETRHFFHKLLLIDLYIVVLTVVWSRSTV